jgi:hypothetical protein
MLLLALLDYDSTTSGVEISWNPRNALAVARDHFGLDYRY